MDEFFLFGGILVVAMIIIAVHPAPFRHFATTIRDRYRYENVRSKWVNAARKEYPAWFNKHLNPDHSPEDKFDFMMEDVQGVLATRGIDSSMSLAIADHLLQKWPGGFLSYNAWYVLHTAQSMGLLDGNFIPVAESSSVNESTRRMAELYKLGGSEAVRTYNSIMHE